MCTLLLLRRVVDGYPLVLLMNRDEAYNRPSQPPLLSKNGRSIIAPEDRLAGGTWIGVNDMGLAVAISNRHEGEVDTARRSRGLLCKDALGRASGLEVKDFLDEELAEVPYNPFNLLYADRGRAFVTHHGATTQTTELEGRVHVLANLDVDDGSQPRIQRVHELLERLKFEDLEDTVASLRILAADHETVDDQAICSHQEEAGTVSSTILALAEEYPRRSLFLYSGERPCQGHYEDYSALLEDLMV